MSEAASMTDASAVLQLENISKSYSGVPALLDVSLEVRAGEVHALLGENGAGKSTLMGVASGALQPNDGTIRIGGELVQDLTPTLATELGIAIVHQHPAVLPDLTVAENIRLAVPIQYLQGDSRAAMQAMLVDVGCTAHLSDRVDQLSVAQQHLLELAKALVRKPRVLILDEPTAPLSQSSVDVLFQRVRLAAAAGTAVIYITHRLAEVRELADRVTVLRDGKYRGTADVADVTDSDLLSWIVGRQLNSTFPPKPQVEETAPEYLSIVGLSGPGFDAVNVTLKRGEILGVGGVIGNGQSDFMAGLAGLHKTQGAIVINGREFDARRLRSASAYLPSDRQHEGLMMSLSVRENAAVTALGRFVRAGLVRGVDETRIVGKELSDLTVKATSMDAAVSSLSGGNQQKVLLARALLSNPAIVIADEPTQGVDVGARAEIYGFLRKIADSGTPVVVASSDAKELEGLCDRVLVMSRGHVVADLVDQEISEERLIHAAVTSTAKRDEGAAMSASSRIGRFMRGDYAPVGILAIVMLALGAYITTQNDRYISDFNITSVQMLVAALGFMALGQTIALLTGGIDLSVGPLSGFLVVITSFFVNDGSPGVKMLAGVLLAGIASLIVGLINGSFIRFAGFTPVAATLVMYIALQGMSFVLRDGPDGIINSDVSALIQTKWGPFPAAFVLLVVLVFVMEYALRYTGWGLRLRAIGSHEESARRVGVRTTRTFVLAYITASAFVFLGALLLMAQIGIGDPSQGVGYTLSSITAVVLGGTSLLGGRGTFVGTLLGAGLIIQLLNATTFLGLSDAWQYLFQGALIVAAAIIYSQVRRHRTRA